jgi:hypothetical protein
MGLSNSKTLVPLWTQVQSRMKVTLGMGLDNLLGTLERVFELDTKNKDTPP